MSSNNNGLTTNLNQQPYVADYDANAQYYPILFKPSTAVQTRELNNLQLTAQHQIALFGQNIFTPGTIIQGCNITFNGNLPYVKILDTYANGSAYTISDFNNLYAVSNSGLKAYIFSTNPGLVSLSPNLNTLYVNYLNSATNTQIKVFQNDEILSIYTSANLMIGQVQVANTISSGSSNTTGYGYSVTVDNGAIFTKGMCLDVKKQSVIVSPYSNQPNNLSVGFSAIESIVTAYEDQSLLDNSQGAPNYAAPGADRLKIVPTLTVIQSNTANQLSNSFFSIVDFIGGAPSIVNQDTQYSVIGDKMAQISNETNGSFVVRPFNVRCLQNYLANGSIDPQYMKLEVDAGLAYIKGYRIQVVGKLLNVIAKGLATNTATSQIVTTQMGNYLQLQEVSGSFNPTIAQPVSLRSAPAYAVSNNLAKGIGADSISPPGSQIGTADLIGFQWVSGTPSSQTAQYYAYLFNVQMSGTNSFGSVRSIYANSGGYYGFGDIILQNNTAVLQASNVASLIYPLNQQAVATLKTSSNTVDTQFVYQQSTNVSFSNTGTVSVTIPSYIGGINELPYGVGTLSTSLMENFIVTCETAVHTANIAGSASISGNVVTGIGTSFNTSLYVNCLLTLANSTVTETRQVSTIANATSLTTTTNWTNAWSGANAYITYENGHIIPLSYANSSVSVSNSTNFSINLNQNFNTTFSASVLYPIERTQATPAKKQLQTNTYVLINCSNNVGGTTGPWCLGVPDVYSVANIWVGSTYSNTNPSVTNLFTLKNGQTDTYYGLSYLYSNGASLTNSSLILVQLEAFQQDLSHGDGFYSVDSYPIDDTGATPNSIFTASIPTYVSNTTGTVYPLRNCVDFRLVASNTIPYVSNLTNAILPNTSIINPANTLSFNVSNPMIPIPDDQFETSLQYYMGRYDTVGLSTTGNIIVNQGAPAENPIPPGDVKSGMTLGTVYVPPYPSLTPDAVPNGYSTYSSSPLVSITPRANRRYTMADIGVLDNRISQVEYYTSLSLLELSAQNLLLTSNNGTNLFQSGMFADPMQDFSRCNTLDPAFNIAIDSYNSVARPIFHQGLINLKYSNSLSSNTSLSNNGRLITLTPTQAGSPLISQPCASQVRNASQDTTYTWVGDVVTIPEGDYVPDVTVNPTVVVNINSYSNWINLVNAWGTQWGAWNETSNTSVSTSTIASGNKSTTTTTTTTTTTQTQTGTQLQIVGANTTTYNFGDVVTSVALQPFVRAQVIQFYAHGLKPSTQHWAFFNDVAIQNYVTQTDSNYNILNASSNVLTTDSTGTLYGLFYIPAQTFYAGYLNFQLFDINNLTTESQVITSAATCIFNGTNLAYTENDLELQTTTPQLAVTTVSQSMTTTRVSSNSVTTITNPATVINYNLINHTWNSGGTGSGDGAGPGGGPAGGSGPGGPGSSSGNGGPGSDPLAQSFTITPNMVLSGAQGVFVSSIDLFFMQTDPNLGITFMIREMDNGSPSPTIVPFSAVHLTPNQVNISTNASKATNIQFPAPVFLKVNSSYCFVLMPDGSNPNYFIWTGVIGGTDVLTGAPIFTNSSTGIMFLSSQNQTWTPYQSEAVKFNLYYYLFNSSVGTAVFTNDDTDYLSIGTTSRNFTLNEYVYFSNSVFLASNVSVSNSTASVTANTTGLAAGQKIYIQSNTNNYTLIANVNSITDGNHFVMNVTPSFTDSNASMGKLVSNGGLMGFVKTANSTVLYVTNTTANATVYLSNVTNMMAIGGNSGASALITSLNDVPYDTIMPKFSTMVPTYTSLALSMKGTANSFNNYTADANYLPLTFGQSTDFFDEERVIMSKSNELNHSSGNKSLQLTANMVSYYTTLSPVFDTVKCGAWRVHNIVVAEDANNDVFNSEISNLGTSNNRYISLTVNLSANQPAEQLIVYMDAYLPPQTNVYCYAKIQNQYDSDAFANKTWSPMYTTNMARSSAVNVNDINEYVFNFPTSNASIWGTNNSIAYLDSANNGCVAYTTSGGITFESFTTFAIKLAFVSSAGSQIVPRVHALRCIALA